MLTHAGERPYKCEVDGCDYRVTQNGSLKRHMLIHTGERPFKCDVDGCDFRCTQNNNLERHMLIHTGERPYKCEFEGGDYRCNTSFICKKGGDYLINIKLYLFMLDNCSFLKNYDRLDVDN